jgi:hypothetical protein
MDGQVFSTSPGKRKILRNGDANTLVIPNVFPTLPPPLRVCDNSGFVFSRSVRATVRADIFNVFNVVNLGLLMSALTVTSALPGRLQVLRLSTTRRSGKCSSQFALSSRISGNPRPA